jgi:hypothetical protein
MKVTKYKNPYGQIKLTFSSYVTETRHELKKVEVILAELNLINLKHNFHD